MNDVVPASSQMIERPSIQWRPHRSFRWRLQAWHALVLTAVLAVFGLVVYALAWQSRLQQIDAELDRTAEVIVSRLRRLFPWPQPFRGPPPIWPPQPSRSDNSMASRVEPGAQRSEDRGSRGDRRSQRSEELGGRSERDARRREEAENSPVSALAAINVSREPREPGTSRDPNSTRDPNAPRIPRSGEWPAPSLGLPEEFLQLFKGNDDSRLYFVVWDREGKMLQKSDSAPEVPFPAKKVGEDRLPVRDVRSRGTKREVVHVSSFDINVLVGRSIVKDLASQRRLGALLGLAGLSVLVAGLVGGWYTSSRAIRPIAAMTATAESISALRLSQRIDLKETDNELGQLAMVLNRTFDRLQSAFEQQVRFTADASHELRTPLSVILAHTDLALSRPRSPEEYRETLATCRRASHRMKALIDGLLTLARFDSDAASLQFGQVDLEALARECVDLVRPLADERQVTIQVNASSVIVRGDRERLSQVFTNLLTNAIRYNRDGGTVQVDVTSDKGLAVIQVIDSGIGIAADELPHIFERFYRVDKARSRADGGSGLGLSICQTIVAAHGGSIVARSQPDVGTTMEVRLPVAARVPQSGDKLNS